MPNDLVPNRPTETGRMLGEQLARLTDVAESEQIKKFPNAKKRCASCAFKAGTLPNGCEATLMDAVKAVVQMDDFMCHMDLDAERKPQHHCVGWFLLMGAGGIDAKPIEVPWEYDGVDDGTGPG